MTKFFWNMAETWMARRHHRVIDVIGEVAFIERTRFAPLKYKQ